MDKNYKIWGVSYGLIGDLVMGLPVLSYFEKKYPNSYKNWVIQKKCSQCADLFINHPLIDRIKVTDSWNDFGDKDYEIYNNCDIKTPLNQHHKINDWYNYRNCIEETAILAGIDDLCDVLEKEERIPKLYKWFDIGIKSPVNTGYSDSYDSSNAYVKKNIAIWPFANYAQNEKRSPTLQWWIKIVDALISIGYSVNHFGYMTEPRISTNERYNCFTDRSFSDQVKLALTSDLCIGTDSGSMWIMGAYEHPSVCILTYWMPGHIKNPMALAPVNKNMKVLFDKESCDNIKTEDILSYISERGI